jgi:5-methylcytosine-specific restriction endonuclease McrA
MPYASRSDRAASARRYYWRHSNAVKALASQHKNQQRRILRAAVEKFKARPCTDCGGRYPTIVMDLDHVRFPKRSDVANLVRAAVSIRTLKAELAKCEVVCANCHRLRTGRADGARAAPRLHKPKIAGFNSQPRNQLSLLNAGST